MSSSWKQPDQAVLLTSTLHTDGIDRGHTKVMASPSLYRPINGPNTIRLLRLLKGTKNYEEDPIRCELFEAPLPDGDDDEAYYEALSYTWGDASETGTIIIDGRPTTVTANLHKALGHLRQTDEDRILWVDALCINQGDHSERMHQVGKMGNIYKKAREVIIWLGITTEKIDLLLRGVQLLDQKMIRIPKPRTDDPVYLEIWLDAARRHLGKLKTMDLEVHEMRVQGLQELLARDWWRRIWVIQEAANAARARIQCSWRSVPTRTFALMPQLMGISPGPREEALLEVLPGPLRKHSWWHTDRSLETLLEKFQYSESKEECDQIYALLGMSSETTVPGCPLQADYSLSTTRIVQNTVSFLALGELADLEVCPLPHWELPELRRFLPLLRPRLLAWSLTQNHIALTKKLLDSNPPCAENPGQERLDINQAVDGFTPLGYAASRGQLDLIHLFSRRSDIKLRQRDPQGYSATRRALENDHLEAIEALVALDREILKDEGWNLLHQAIKANRPLVVQMLLACHDVDVNRSSESFTPLNLAAKLGHIDIVRLLLTRQDLDIGASDPAGFLPLERAMWAYHSTMATGVYSSIMALLFEHGGPSLLQNSGRRLLALAISQDWAVVICMLISHGVSPDETSITLDKHRISVSPLAFAVQLQHFEAVQALLEAGADPQPGPPPESATDKPSPELWCPIVLAIRSGSLPLLEMLLSTGKGAHITTWKAPNEDPLIYAIRERHAGMVKMLLARGADVGARTEQRKLPSFWLAVEYNAPKIMRLLADYGADFTVSSSSHPQVYQGRWGLKFTPWFQKFLEERHLSAADVWRFQPGEGILHTRTPLTRWQWKIASAER
ncbi:heterokaryon incompatibility protein-domain-containing protein [Plectosphaerella cucumerina]|uniref:Heterokaryon incompatibility protein-domain-containing protein n=1 Tax=Plectosphaerella cucumerina TaxID=40658 RepID=A0A8K0X9P8_9PEZI|nr:heterokaryon incompatibility protein-domain-containing protein [Plectosphaerella cucumerina]